MFSFYLGVACANLPCYGWLSFLLGSGFASYFLVFRTSKAQGPYSAYQGFEPSSFSSWGENAPFSRTIPTFQATPFLNSKHGKVRHSFLWKEMPQEDWQKVSEKGQLFLQAPYLRALESSHPKNTSFSYALFYKEEVAVGAALFSWIDVDLDEIGSDISPLFLKGILGVMGQSIQKKEGRSVVRMVMCGNPLLSDESCGFVHDSSMTSTEMLDWIADLMKELQAQKSQEEGSFFALQTIKDLSVAQNSLSEKALRERGFFPLEGQPMMRVSMDASWKTFEDYLSSMSKKYRQRARSARKKGEELQRLPLSCEEIKQAEAKLDFLLEQVCEQSGFRLTSVQADYFTALKRELGEQFQLVVYLLDGEWIGFAATLQNGKKLDAHLVGMNYEYNQSHKVYQNMLYDFVETAIERELSSVCLGRTAMEIKSSVGAEPETLTFYLHHSSVLFNPLLGMALKQIPVTDWTPRNPFQK